MPRPIRHIRRAAISRACLALCAVVLLVACESKVTRENFDKIQVGMTMPQVEDLLGAGTDDTSSGGFGVSGGGVADISRGPADKTYVWKTDSGGKIVITFAAGKVVQKQMTE